MQRGNKTFQDTALKKIDATVEDILYRNKEGRLKIMCCGILSAEIRISIGIKGKQEDSF